MKILHVTHHHGCKLSVDFVCEQLGHSVETQFADWNYNMSAELAAELWNKYENYYNSFDAIITSDTASISRIFLQNNYKNKLIIWVCNRFDYADGSTNNCGFPDADFIKLFREASSRHNVSVRSYTKFEHEYAQKYYGFSWNDDVIRPCSSVEDVVPVNSAIPCDINRSDTFFITRYHNDNIFMSMKAKCDEMDISSYSGEYSGPADLIGFRGIIHIPYAWSNLALFENWSIGNVYLVPSKAFLLKLCTTGNFFWSPPFDKDYIDSSEWYLPEHAPMMIYFDSFDHLKELAKDDNKINNAKEAALKFKDVHFNHTIGQWQKLFES